MRIAKAMCSIFISVLPGRVGKAWYSTNMLERIQRRKIVLSMPEPMQLSSSKFVVCWEAHALMLDDIDLWDA